MPSKRGRSGPALARWLSDPVASDFASRERLAFEATSGERGNGIGGWDKPFHRFLYALDLLYGKDRWPSGLAQPPSWPGAWMPGRQYDPSAYEVLPDGPPETLRAAVDAEQAGRDEQLRQMIEQNSRGSVAEMMLRCGIPPREGFEAVSDGEWPAGAAPDA